jgi:hypothetical protein
LTKSFRNGIIKTQRERDTTSRVKEITIMTTSNNIAMWIANSNLDNTTACPEWLSIALVALVVAFGVATIAAIIAVNKN